MADETRLAELTDVFLSELKTLVGLRHTYSRFGGGGLTRSDIQQIWADAHKERDRLHANFPLTDDRSRDAEAWTALEQNHFRRVEQDINARVVLPFCVRLDKTIDTVIGMCPNNFIEHCIRD